MVNLIGTLSPGGYNLREGGGSRGKASEESKQRMRKPKSEEAKQNMKRSEETKKKISKSLLGENNPMFGRTGEKNPNYGSKRSEESKQKHSESTKGEKHHMYGKTGEKHNRSKRVYQYDLDETFIDSFGSIEEAGRYLNKTTGSSIGKCARGSQKHKTAYKFKWSYTFPFI